MRKRERERERERDAKMGGTNAQSKWNENKGGLLWEEPTSRSNKVAANKTRSNCAKIKLKIIDHLK